MVSKRETPIDAEELRKMARLARMPVTEDELSALLPAVEQLLALFDQLRSAPGLDSAAPAASPPSAPLRRDEVKPGMGAEILAQAPEVENSGFQVPAILAGSG